MCTELNRHFPTPPFGNSQLHLPSAEQPDYSHMDAYHEASQGNSGGRLHILLSKYEHVPSASIDMSRQRTSCPAANL